MTKRILYEPLAAPNLDPKNEKELVELALARIFHQSGGKINDFSSSSPARVLTEGLCFAIAEMLYYANQLPEAMSIKFLQIAGIQRYLGTTAQATIQFTLKDPLDGPFILPAGYPLLTSSQKITFSLDSQLVIPPGQVTGEGFATCNQIGTVGNVPANTITRIPQSIAYLQSITNPQPAGGGTDAETLEQTKARGFEALRRRGLISQSDYEEESQVFLGHGSISKAVGNVGQDGETEAPTHVHVFCLNPDGSQLNSAQISSLRNHLRRKSLITVADFVWVSSIDYIPVHLEVIVKIAPNLASSAIAEAIYQNLLNYLQPGKFEIGSEIIIKELEFVTRLAGGIEYVHSVAISREYLQVYSPTNFPMTTPYSTPQLRSVYLILIAPEGEFRYVKGIPQ